MLYDYLKDNYKKIEPIFIEDIIEEGVSRDKIRKELNCLVDKKILRRFDREVYYLPKKCFIGEEKLNLDEVIRRKYIDRRGNRFGYYSGKTLAFRMGINKKQSDVIEIISNNMKCNKICKEGMYTTFIIRKPRIIIDSDNYIVLQLLDLLNDIEAIAEDKRYAEIKIKEYIKDNCIKRSDIDKYIGLYPLRVYKNYYDMRLEEALMY